MTVFVNDTFTGADGTELTSHTGETGRRGLIIQPLLVVVIVLSWLEIGSVGIQFILLLMRRVRPASADYTVSANFRKHGTPNANGFSVHFW